MKGEATNMGNVLIITGFSLPAKFNLIMKNYIFRFKNQIGLKFQNEKCNPLPNLPHPAFHGPLTKGNHIQNLILFSGIHLNLAR